MSDTKRKNRLQKTRIKSDVVSIEIKADLIRAFGSLIDLSEQIEQAQVCTATLSTEVDWDSANGYVQKFEAERAAVFARLQDIIPAFTDERDMYKAFERFGTHSNGLGLTEDELIDLLGHRGEFMKRFRAWSPKGLSRGAPKKPEAEKTRAHWVKMGRPRLTAGVCDELAQHTYPGDYARAERYSTARKTLRDRVARQVRPLINKAAPTTPTT